MVLHKDAAGRFKKTKDKKTKEKEAAGRFVLVRFPDPP